MKRNFNLRPSRGLVAFLVILALSGLIYFANNYTPHESTTEKAPKTTPEGEVVVNIFGTLLEITTGFEGLSSLDDKPSVATEDKPSRQTLPRLPILLSASGNFWVDQNGEKMSSLEVERFFSKNPRLADRILRYNSDNLYTSRLYSPERDQKLRQLLSEASDNFRALVGDPSLGYEGDELRSVTLSRIFVQAMNEHPPKIETLELFYEYLNCNAAQENIMFLTDYLKIKESQLELIEDDESEDYDTDRLCNFVNMDTKDQICNIFFACLVSFTDNGILENVLYDVTPNPSRIPIVLTDGGLWYDQNGNPLLTLEVENFANENPDLFSEIVWLNFSHNPYFHPESLDPQYGTDLWVTAHDSKIFSYENTLNPTYRALDELISHCASSMAFSQFTQDLFKTSRAGDGFYLTDHTDVLTIIRNIGGLNRASIVETCGFSVDSGNCADYLFVLTLSKMLEDGKIGQMGENL